jgi:hypothetical protein
MPNLLRSKYSLAIFTLMLFCVRLDCLAQNWQIVGGGFSRDVGTLTVDSTTNSLYIGGSFKYADTINCDGLINWDGNAFTKLTKPLSNCGNYCGPAGSVIRYNNRLFMNGNYGPYNGKLERLFEYVNNNWVVSCTIKNGGIESLKIINNQLFAFGTFDSLCHKNVARLAVFNGTDWDNFNGVLNAGYRMRTGLYHKGEYYFAGNFSAGNGIKEIMRWTGSQWSSLQNGILGSDAEINCMEVFNGILYVGGYFFEADGNASNHILAWDGQNWFNPFPQIIYLASIPDMKVINKQLYISGNYIIPADNDSSMYSLARYDGCDFNVFGGSYKYPENDYPPNCIAGLRDRIYVAVRDSFMHQKAKFLMSIPESVTNIKTIHISDCPIQNTDLNFSIFPNPYSDNITVQISSVFNLSEAKIFITNNLGQLLLTFYPNNYSQLLNLSSLSSGMYFLTVQGNENKRTVKIIKQ